MLNELLTACSFSGGEAADGEDAKHCFRTFLVPNLL